jgi:hypothetical protein
VQLQFPREKTQAKQKVWACNDFVMLYALLMKQGATPFIKKNELHCSKITLEIAALLRQIIFSLDSSTLDVANDFRCP